MHKRDAEFELLMNDKRISHSISLNLLAIKLYSSKMYQSERSWSWMPTIVVNYWPLIIEHVLGLDKKICNRLMWGGVVIIMPHLKGCVKKINLTHSIILNLKGDNLTPSIHLTINKYNYKSNDALCQSMITSTN